MKLIRYDAACRAIAAAKSVDEAKDIRDKAEAMRAYARLSKNRDLETDAWEIRIRAERRIGELIKAQRESVGLNKGAVKGKTGSKGNPVLDARPTLASVGINKPLASRSRQLEKISRQKFEKLIATGRQRISDEKERVSVDLLREGDRAQKAAFTPQPIPSGKFSLIYADPPWRYEHVKTENRAIENQYPTMDLDEICALPIQDLCAIDCTLFLWATSPKLEEAMRALKSWGFSYRTCAVWDKEKMGMGYYFRQQHELLLVATRGQPAVPEPGDRLSSVIRAKRLEHSAKPAVVYEILERMYPTAKRIELFCRRQRHGWTAWGNEIEAAA